MRLISTGVIALLAVTALAQSLFTYRDRSGTLVIKANSGSATRQPGDNLKLILKGNPLTIDDKASGLTLSSSRATAMVAPGKDVASRLRSVVTEGRTTAAQTQKNSKTTVSADKVTYSSKGESGKAVFTGNVVLTNQDTASRQTLKATGATGQTDFSLNNTKSRDLKAVLEGNVQTEIDDSGPNGPAKLHTSSNRMVLVYSNRATTVTLTGNVRIDGQGASRFGQYTNLSRAVLTLDGKGHVVRFESEAK